MSHCASIENEPVIAVVKNVCLCVSYTCECGYFVSLQLLDSLYSYKLSLCKGSHKHTYLIVNGVCVSRMS